MEDGDMVMQSFVRTWNLQLNSMFNLYTHPQKTPAKDLHHNMAHNGHNVPENLRKHSACIKLDCF